MAGPRERVSFRRKWCCHETGAPSETDGSRGHARPSRHVAVRGRRLRRGPEGVPTIGRRLRRRRLEAGCPDLRTAVLARRTFDRPDLHGRSRRDVPAGPRMRGSHVSGAVRCRRGGSKLEWVRVLSPDAAALEAPSPVVSRGVHRQYIDQAGRPLSRARGKVPRRLQGALPLESGRRVTRPAHRPDRPG